MKVLYVADMGAGPARADEVGGSYDSEGLAINRENSGPKSGGERQNKSATNKLPALHASHASTTVVDLLWSHCPVTVISGRLVVEGLLKREDLSEYNMVLHNGDLSYACGESILHEEFGTLIEPIASR